MSKRAIQAPEDAFDVSAVNATGGTPKRVERFDLINATVQAVVSSGSYLVQGSIDGTNWSDVGGGAITGNAFIVLAVQVRYLRVLTTTAGDGEFTLFAYENLY